VRVQELAKAQGGEAYANALRELFDLDPHIPAAVTTLDRGLFRVPPTAG
jgi:glutamyl-tRNA reductase